MKLQRLFIAVLFITVGLFFTSCSFANDDTSSSSDSYPDMSAPSLTCCSFNTGEVEFITEVITNTVGKPKVELWLYYNTDGSDDKNYYGEFPSTRSIQNLISGKKYYFFLRKYCDGKFSPYSAKSSITIR